MDASAILPPVGLIRDTDHGMATTHLTNLAKEATSSASTWHARAERNHEIYLFGASPEPNAGQVVSNQIQDAVNATVDFETKEPANRQLNPIERGEPGQVYYFTPPDMNGQSQVMGPMPPEQAAMMQQDAQPTGQVDPATGAPQMAPVYNPNNFVTIDDRSTAEFFQKQHDVYWSRGNLDKSMRMTKLSSSIFGFFFPVYEWDKAYHKPKLWTDISLKDTYIDPTRAGIEDSAYFGIDWWLDAEQAKMMFPDLADVITVKAKTGTPELPSSETMTTTTQDGAYHRNTIIMRVFWLRNQPCPYEADEAIAAGMLERVQIPIGDPSAQIDTAMYPQGANDATVELHDDQGRDGLPTDLDATDPEAAAGQLAESGMEGMVQGQPAVAPPTRDALISNGIEVTGPTLPDGSIDPNWPMYRCTRQITAVLGLIVDDRECDYWDIPALQSIATPVLYQPFGQGLPERLEMMQEARTQMLTGIRDHTDLNAHPVMVMDRMAWDALPEKYRAEGASRAGMTVVFDHETFVALNGKPQLFLEPPPMNQALVDGERIFHDELTERAGNPDVLQGKPPAGVTGWQSIQMLSQNASSRFGFSMQWSRDAHIRLCRLLLHDLCDPKKVTPRDLRAVDSRYPLQIVEAFQRRGGMVDWDISVDVNTGVGGSRTRKQAQAIEAHQTVSPITGNPVISDETLADMLDVDYEQEQQRNMRARQQAMQMQMQQAAMMPKPAPGAPGESKKQDAPQAA